MIPPHLLWQTQRAREISRLRAYAESKQYDGRPDFYTGVDKAKGIVVPLDERKPIVIYPLPKIAANKVIDFTFGETSFPMLTVPATEDGTGVYELSLSKDEASDLTTALANIVKEAHVRQTISRLMAKALTCRTAVGILSMRDGLPAWETPNAEHCQVTFVENDPNRDVISLTWVYQYDEEFADLDTNSIKTRRLWFRRDVTVTDIIEYAPAAVDDVGLKAPAWAEARKVSHGLGFCPVLWVRNMPSESTSLDGVALLEDQLDECDALNFALSQRHRGIRYFGTPQPYETGVSDEDGPEAFQQRSTAGGGGYSPEGAPFGATAAPKARATAPDRIWSYEGADVKVGLLETSGKAFEVATKYVDDLKSRICEATSIVLAGPDDALTKGAGDLNARLLAMLYAPLLGLVSKLRDETWGPALKRLISLTLRAITALEGQGVLIPDAAGTAKLLRRFLIEVEAKGEDGLPARQMRWVPPAIDMLWGDNFAPGNDEIESGVRGATAAQEAGLITAKTAATFVAPYFGVRHPEQEVEDAQKEASERAEKAQQQFEARAGVGDEANGGTDPEFGARPNGLDETPKEQV